MAAAYLAHLAGDTVEVLSAGSAPASSLNPMAVEAMNEESIDLAKKVPKILADDTVNKSDVVITMGCGDVCPFYPGKRYLDWQLEDPAGQDLQKVREIRNEIRRHVENLIMELKSGGSDDTS